MKLYKWKETSREIREMLLNRASLNIEAVKEQVKPWIDAVREKGDEAVIEYIRRFDDPSFDLSRLEVTSRDIEQAYRVVSDKTLEAMRQQIELSRRHHERQVPPPLVIAENLQGVLVGRRVTPIDRAGLYVPAGKAPLPTVMQILGVAARAAGVPEIVACFPPTGDHDEIIVAADMAGVHRLFRVGGVAAIAAMAFGTQTLPAVDKIVGPGNIYVQAAKMLVFGQVGIDMPAGPSEAVILADDRANPAFVAADILARAEHDENAAGVLITWSEELAAAVVSEVDRQKERLGRKEIIDVSLNRYSAVIIVDSEDEAVDLVNQYAPEHLEIMTRDPLAILPRIRHAASIFLGDYAPVAVGDYASGTNHVLPTGRFARIFSSVGVNTFMKESEIQMITEEGLSRLAPIVSEISRIEGLEAHRRSVEIRLEK